MLKTCPLWIPGKSELGYMRSWNTKIRSLYGICKSLTSLKISMFVSCVVTPKHCVDETYLSQWTDSILRHNKEFTVVNIYETFIYH